MKLERKPDKLGEILVAHKMSTQEEVDAALGEQKKTGERIGEVLVRRDAASLEDVNWALADQFNISYMPISRDQLDPEIVRIVPEEMARKHRLLPLLKVASDLILVVDDPLQEEALEDVERLTGLDVNICLGKTAEILEALDVVYGAREAGVEEAGSIEPLSKRFPKKELVAAAKDASGASLLDRLLKEAYSSKADAVHIDRIGSGTLVRARIGGRLEPWLKLAGDLGGSISTRVRVLAGIGAVSGKGEFGELQWELDGKARRLSVAILPASNGETILLRPAHETITIPPLKDLGLTKAQLKQVRSIVELRRGLIVTTGPRASGKTTTLYAIFHEADPMLEKLVAIEDEPVGMTDLSLSLTVNPSDDLNAILDSALAADPDAVLIQPIPTQEVLDKAIHEALQGIKVGIQLPLTDTAAALSFLLSGDVPAQAVAGALSGVIAQRIVRTLCNKCKKPSKQPAGLKLKDAKPHRAEGCNACKGTGYAGRMAIYEVVIPDANLRAMLGARPDTAAIRSALSDLEIVTLRDRALAMYAEGIVSVEEIAEFI